MIYSVLYTNLAESQLKKLDKSVVARIIAAMDRVRIRPETHLKRLVGDKLYSLRVGDYRVIIDLQKENLIVLVVKIGHRKSIYKKL